MKVTRKQLRKIILNEIKMLAEGIKEDMEELVSEDPENRALGSGKFRSNIQAAKNAATADAVKKLAAKKNVETLSYDIIKFNINHDDKRAYTVIEYNA